MEKKLEPKITENPQSPPNPTEPANNTRHHVHWSLFVGAVLVIGAGLLIAILNFGTDEEMLVLQEPVVNKPVPPVKSHEKTYTNENYGIEFQYPDSLIIGKYKDETLPNASETAKVYRDSGMSEEDIQNAIHPFKDTVVLVEPSVLGNSDLSNLVVGNLSVIAITPHTGAKASFDYRAYIMRPSFGDSKQVADFKPTTITIGNFEVTKLEGYPGPYGTAMYYYLVPIHENLVLEFYGHKEKFNVENNALSIGQLSYYDKVIEQIISTLKFAK